MNQHPVAMWVGSRAASRASLDSQVAVKEFYSGVQRVLYGSTQFRVPLAVTGASAPSVAAVIELWSKR